MLKVRKEFREFLKDFFILVYVFIFICCCLLSIGGLFLSIVHLEGAVDLFEQTGIGVVITFVLLFCYIIGEVFITIVTNIFNFIFERVNNE